MIFQKLYTYGFILITTLLYSKVSGQSPISNWYQPQTKYVRIPIVTPGWYCISKEELREMEFHEGETWQTLQLFKDKKEIPLYVTADTICFWGVGRDGASESDWYTHKTHQPHTLYSLETDTTAYFLTLGTTLGKRIATQTLDSTNSIDSPRLWHEVLYPEREQYVAGIIYPLGAGYDDGVIRSEYDQGEGWMSTDWLTGNIQERTWHWNYLASEVTIELSFTGRQAGVHEILIGSREQILAKVIVADYQSNSVVIALNDSISSEAKLWFRINSTHTNGAVALNYARVRFIPLHEISANQLIVTSEHPWKAKASSWLINIQNPDNPVIFNGNNVGKAMTAIVQQALSLPSYTSLNSPVYRDSIDYLIITTPVLYEEALFYKQYRESEDGGNYKVEVLTTWELYNWFNGGISGGKAIEDGIRYFAENHALQYVLLLGYGVDPQTVRQQRLAWKNEGVPTAGWPGSDLLLVPNKWRSKVGIGRVPARSVKDVRTYLDKVKTHEQRQRASTKSLQWVHLAGGRNRDERTRYRDYLKGYEEQLTISGVVDTVVTFAKRSDELQEKILPTTLLEEGVAVVNFFGHSNLTETDVELSWLTIETSRPWLYYPLLIANGCALGNVFFRTVTLAENWLLAPEQGAIAVLAHTHNGLAGSMQRYTHFLYEVLLAEKAVKKGIGEIRAEAVHYYLQEYPTVTDSITASQMNLLGDPAIVFWPKLLSRKPTNQELLPPIVYPNPANEFFWIEVQDTAFVNGNVIVYDSYGRNLFATSIPGKKLYVNIALWPRGMYWIRITKGEHAEVYPLVKH